MFTHRSFPGFRTGRFARHTHPAPAANLSVSRPLRALATAPLALCLLLLAVAALAAGEPRKPALFLIGDSTVKNGTRGQVGWGTAIASRFDGNKIDVQNRALGGRSSRTYLREGLWDRVLAELKPGDFLIIQFGHNDNGPLDTGKARTSLKGNGDEAREVTLQESGAKETVRSYGWYLQKYIADAKAKGVTAIVCSPVARNIWEEGKVVRSTDSFNRWAREAAAQGGAHFIDLNEAVAKRYEELGAAKVQGLFTAADHTHTNEAGAEVNARCVAEAIRRLGNCALSQYLREEAPPVAAVPSPGANPSICLPPSSAATCRHPL